VAQINDVLKQAAIEEGQWTENREANGSVGISEIMARLNAGRQRVGDAKAALDAAALTKLRSDEYAPTSLPRRRGIRWSVMPAYPWPREEERVIALAPDNLVDERGRGRGRADCIGSSTVATQTVGRIFRGQRRSRTELKCG
jgi:hypothetical protein